MNPPCTQALLLAVIAVACGSASVHSQASASRTAPRLAADPQRPVAVSMAPLPWRGFPGGESASQQAA